MMTARILNNKGMMMRLMSELGVKKISSVMNGLLILGLLASSTEVLSATKLQVNANANQFPYVTVRVHAFDDKNGANITGMTQNDFLLAEDLSAASIEHFKVLSSSATKAEKVDVMFVFDQTGSMSDEIVALLQKTQKFADMIAQSGINYRLGLVSFSDKTELKYDYTADVAQFKKMLSTLTANGGDDEPENQLDALMDATAYPARADAKRIFILVTDAPYHFQDAITKRRPEEVVAALKAQKIQLHVVGPELDAYKKMSQDLAGNFYDKDSDDFSSIVTSIGGEISANYEFSYRSPRMFSDGTRRAVRVALKDEIGTDAAQYVAPWFAMASSRQDAAHGDESAYSPHKVLDGDTATAWFPSDVGMSNNEWMHLALPVARNVSKVTVKAATGYQFSEKNTATLSLDGGASLLGMRSADGALLIFATDKPLPIHQIHIDLHLAAGVRMGIAELEVFLPDNSLIPEIAMHHVSVLKRETAKELNARGEKTYHAGKVNASVGLYLSAIDADPEFSQAYSNLGLSYWKLKDYVKSVAANRSAIALAKQQGKSTVIANSYYNIARTFEEQKEYKQALMNFWWANKTVAKPAYQKAILRMNALLALDAE